MEVRKRYSGLDLLKKIENNEIENRQRINMYIRGYEEYPTKLVYSNNAIWKCDSENVPDEELEARISYFLAQDNSFELVKETGLEKIGYKLTEENISTRRYERKTSDSFIYEIEFLKGLKEVGKFLKGKEQGGYMSAEELKAVMEEVEKLKW